MHEFLQAIGLKSLKTKKELKLLTEWVLARPDRFRVSDTGDEENVAMAERLTADSAGVAVVGSVNEQGTMVPEYYFPFLQSRVASSDAPISVEKQVARNGYIGLVEDDRLNLSLIFHVKNVIDAVKCEKGADFKSVSLSLLASDATVLLPIAVPEKVLKSREERKKRQEKLMNDLANGDTEAFEKMARESVERFEKMMARVEKADVYSVVDSFFMPHGMESDRYYFLGTITNCREEENRLTEEKFYVMVIDVNGVEFSVSVNASDLTGVPAEGYRLRGHGWLLGELWT